MGTITEIRPRNGRGPSAWRVQIRKKRGGVIVFSKVQTFKREKAARDWDRKIEAELAKPGALDRAIAAAAAPRNPTLGNAIDRTLSDRVKEVGRTTKDNLRIVQRRKIPAMACEDVKRPT